MHEMGTHSPAKNLHQKKKRQNHHDQHQESFKGGPESKSQNQEYNHQGKDWKKPNAWKKHIPMKLRTPAVKLKACHIDQKYHTNHNSRNDQGRAIAFLEPFPVLAAFFVGLRLSEPVFDIMVFISDVFLNIADVHIMPVHFKALGRCHRGWNGDP